MFTRWALYDRQTDEILMTGTHLGVWKQAKRLNKEMGYERYAIKKIRMGNKNART